jgi:hypothetical protein
VPGNFNALTDLVDKNEMPINLTDFKNPQIIKMKQVFLTPAQLTLMNLKADADQSTIDQAFSDLAAQAGKVPQLTADLSIANTEKTTAVNDLAAFKKTATEQKVKDLVAGAIADKKITKEVGEKLSKTFEGKPEELKDLIDAMPKYQSVSETLSDNQKKVTEENQKKTWDELDKAGKLPALKASDPDLFKAKYKEKFSQEYKD